MTQRRGFGSTKIMKSISSEKIKFQLQPRFMTAPTSAIERTNIHNLLIQAEAVDHYMHKKFTTFVIYRYNTHKI